MKITATLLSIPPYISTTWDNIASLHVRAEGPLFTLVIQAKSQSQVEIPHLTKQSIDEIFEAHARFTEEHPPTRNPLEGPFGFTLPLKSDGSFESLATSMQHNPDQADLPPIPENLLKKITLIARAFGLQETAFADPKPNCNCVYCQVNRALQGETAPIEIEEVSQEDLKFRDWEIKQTADKLYTATNPLDANEQYTVFLGTPLGCTCGSKNCEHIRAVLTS
jgi:hypothetical protein